MKLRRAMWLAGLAWTMYRRSKRAQHAVRTTTRSALKRARRAI